MYVQVSGAKLDMSGSYIVPHVQVVYIYFDEAATGISFVMQLVELEKTKPRAYIALGKHCSCRS